MLKTSNKMVGYYWLSAQIIILTTHFVPPIQNRWLVASYNSIPLKLTGYLVIIVGLIIAFASLLSLGENLSPLPDPKNNSKLITNKMYSYCRHPLYLSMLIISFGINIILLSVVHIILFAALFLILRGKAIYEEKKLVLKFNAYYRYSTKVPALAKGIFGFDWKVDKRLTKGSNVNIS